jgi:SAM-dependent methyltransferase
VIATVEAPPLTGWPAVPSALREIRRAVRYRRHILDACLRWATPLMKGVVVDLGGKRDRRRGTFEPALDPGTTWIYVNIDAGTRPDVFADVAAVPIADGAVDCIVCTEVLEHIPDPVACVREVRRLLRPGGAFIGSVPFLIPIHADPDDFQRFTAHGLRQLFRDFSRVEILRMGGYFGVLGTFIEMGMRQIPEKRPGSLLLRRAFFECGRLLQWWDARMFDTAPSSSAFTTGYFVVAFR